MSTEDDDVRVSTIEFIASTGGPIILKERKGCLAREQFASWEEVFTEHIGMIPDETLAYGITIEEIKTGKRFSVVLVFSGDLVWLGQGVKNGVTITRAQGF